MAKEKTDAENGKTEERKPTLYAVLRVTEMPSVSQEEEQGGLRIGEKLELVAVREAKSSDDCYRIHKAHVETEWAKRRDAGEEGLPDVFDPEYFRCVAVTAFLPGYGVEEQRGTRGFQF